MSRPVVIAFFALMAGVALGDFLLYDARWMGIPNPYTTWLLMAPCGFCLLLTVVGFFCYRREQQTLVFARRSWFPLLAFLFFLSLGFGRYAMTAERQHLEWALQGRPVNRGNPDEFDVVRWKWVSGDAPTSRMKDEGLGLRERLLERLRGLGMEKQTMAVVAAMTLGDRSGVNREMRQQFADAGASHLLALSGLHLGIIVGLFLQWMNGPLLLSRWRRLLGLCVLAFIWMYALVAGFPTSLVRAALMTSVFVIACLLNRYGNSLQHLLLTGILMLLWRPMFLFDVGAQLSFLSVAGILLFYSPLYMFFFTHWRYQVFRLERYHLLWPLRLVAVSLCAQVLTLPLVAYYFHQIPVYGALLSIILIPLTTLLIYGAMFVLMLTFVWPSLASLLSVGLTWVVSAMLWLMAQVSAWPGAVVHDFWSRKAEPQVVVYHNRKCPALHVIASPTQSWLLMPEPERADSGMFYIRRDFWKRRLTQEPVLLKGKRAIALKDGFSAVMVKEGSGDAAACPTTMKVDILWVVRGFKGGRLGALSKVYQPRLLVLDASLPLWQRQALAKEAWQQKWKVYDVAEQGALRLK